MFAKEFVRSTSADTLAQTLLLGLLLAAPAAAQTPTNCEDALDASGGGTTLVHNQTLSTQKGVDQWDSDIIKVTAPRPGLLDISAAGASSQGSLFSGAPSASTFQLVNGSPVGTGHRLSTTVVAGKVYCIEVHPLTGATGDLTVDVKFTDPCQMGQPDDHGDSFTCATEIDPLSSTTSGSITTGDHDVFTFEITSTQTIELKSTGTTDVMAKLYDADGVLVTSDSDSGVDSNFEIVYQSLNAGRYYLRVKSENSGSGNYSLVAF
ncbi:MAG TPA: PPC domain-containing protein [Thermoanaerobaculia bacterium]|nr:PPC domain-containing protein [Thermoanaerobaculia bacterium]